MRKVPPVVTDLGVGVALAVLVLTAAWTGWGPPGVPNAREVDVAAIGLTAVLAGALAVRRRYPSAVVIAANALPLAWLLAEYPGRLITLAPLIALYTATVHRGWRQGIAAVAVTGLGMTLIALTVDGVSVVGEPPPNPEVVFTAYVIGIAVHYRRELVSALSGQHAREAQAREERARRHAVEQRLRIARDVHDIVGHAMATISVQAGVAIHVIEQRPDQALRALTAIKKISDEGLADVKSILATLHAEDDPALPRTPPPRLDQLDPLLDATRAAGLRVDLTVHGDERPLPAAVDLAAYRIVQESLTNVLRHAGARTARLDLDYEPTRLAIRIRDDGTGPTDTGSTGRGIAGMRERATALSGQLTADVHPDGGFEVRCVLPTQDES
ncbi:sensor histidine kinase [Saccharothrix deserti]|uniref:sensor histidine kinase n=1 Tax=Saccharothrix deserti TaxID=2593674 RepID=UPI00131BFFB2|nr:sensor histidine kinase [Saccharothrix deserti]